MSQPNGAAPSEYLPRTDAGARKVVERIDALATSLNGRINSTDEDVADLRKSVNRRFKHKVSIGWLVGILLPVGGSLVAFVVKAQSDTRTEMTEARKDLAADVRQVRTEQAARIQNIEAQTGAIYRLLVEQQPRAAVRAEAEKVIDKEK